MRAVFAFGVILLSGLACAPPAVPDKLPPPSHPTRLAGPPVEDHVRLSPDGSHVAVGFPPTVIDVETADAETAPGPWAAGWSEVYLGDDGSASLWHPDAGLDGLTDLGPAVSVEQDRLVAVLTDDTSVTLVDKDAGRTLEAVPGHSPLFVTDGVAVWTTTGDAQTLWTGAAHIDVTTQTAISATNPRFLVLFDRDSGEESLVERSTGQRTAVDADRDISLVPDGRYLDITGNTTPATTATVVDGDARTSICETTHSTGGIVARGYFIVCAGELRHIDGGFIARAPPGGFFGALDAAPSGSGVTGLIHEPGALFPSGWVVRFPDGAVSGGSATGFVTPEARWAPDEHAVTFFGASPYQVLAVNEAGQSHLFGELSFNRVFVDERFVFIETDEGVFALNTATMVELALGDVHFAHGSRGRIVAVDNDHELVVFHGADPTPDVVAPGPVDGILLVAGNVVVASSGDDYVFFTLAS